MRASRSVSPSGPAARPSLAEETCSKIRRALAEGVFEPGQKVSEPELALRFRISRSPVREALVRLELEGFVERLPSGRLIVKALDVADLKQLYVVRAVMEGLAARLATPQLRTTDLERMAGSIDVMEQCVRKGDADGAIAAGRDFHEVIIRECPNRPLVELLAGLAARISRYRALVASLGDYDRERVTEHRRILKALYQRNAEAAEQEVIRHVNRSAGVLIEKLEAKGQKTVGKKASRG